MADVRELGRKVKAKYPGQYDDLSDDDLGRRVKAKHPGAYDDFTDTPAAPQAAGPSFLENVAIGAKRTGATLADSAMSLAEAVGSAAGGDFRPISQLAERVGRGAVNSAAYFTAGAPKDPRLSELQAEVTARQASAPGFKQTRAIRQRADERAGMDPSLGGKLTRGVTEGVLSAVPAVVTSVASGGSVPAVAAITALQSASVPENLAANVALSSVPLPAVAPILRRLRGVKAGVTAVEDAAEQASIRGRADVAALEAPVPSQTLPSRPNLADGPPPLLEEVELAPFGVTEGKVRPRQPGASGPRMTEYEFSEVGRATDPMLGTKAERTPILEAISALRKAGLLTGLKTHIKNVGGTGAFQISEELSRIPGAVADMIVGKVTGRRTLSGPNLASVGRSAYEAATSGIAEAKKALKTGQTKYDLEGLKEIASGSKVIDTYVNGVFRTLKAEDAVFRAYAVRRSLEDRAKALALTEMRQGKITRGAVGERTRELLKAPPADMEAAALLDAEVATFNNSNVVSDALSAGIERLPKGGQFIVDQIVPFRKTPTNVIARMLESSPLGFGKNAYQLAKGITKKSFTEAEQRAFSQTFGRASLGSGLIALGYKGYKDGWLTGLIEDEPSKRARDTAVGRTPGSIKVGDTWHQLTGFAPFGPLLAIGATLARETEQEQEGTGTLPALEVLGQAVGEQPLLVGTKQVAEGLAKPGTVGEKFLGGYAGSLVPTAVSDVAEAFDPQQRTATGITGRAQSRIPGARNYLPPAQDVLGQPRQDFGPVQAFLDPTRATTDVASNNPLFAELVRLDVGLSGFEKKKDETPEAFRTKTREFGSLYIPAGQQLVSSREYARATEEVKREAVKILNRRAKNIVEEDKQPGGTLSPASVMAGAVSAVNKEKTKKNAGKR